MNKQYPSGMKRLIGWAIVVMGVIALLAAKPAAASDITYTDVSFQGSGGVTLHGVIVSPASSRGERVHPGIVLVHGSGIGKRDSYMQEAEAFARGGIVTLVYDKRTIGYSINQRDYSVLTDDALAGVHLLQQQPDVNPDMVGLWGLSEGGYVVPLAATKSRDIAFLVLVGAPGVPPAQQTVWSVTNNLIHAGASGSTVDKFVPNV